MTSPAFLDFQRAIHDGDLAEVRALLDLGMDPNAPSSSGHSPLRSVLLFRHDDVACLLRERGARVGLYEAALWGDLDLARSLLDGDPGIVNRADRRSGATALHAAVGRGHAEVVALLLERGARSDAATKTGYTPLAIACLEGFPAVADLLVTAGRHPVGVVEAAFLGDAAILARFLDTGAGIETRDAADRTPLIAAAGCGHVECVQLLLRRGARPDAVTRRYQTALKIAAGCNRVPIIHLLLDQGAISMRPTASYGARR